MVVDATPQEVAQRRVVGTTGGGEGDQRRVRRADVVDAPGFEPHEPVRRRRHHVADHHGDLATHELVDRARLARRDAVEKGRDAAQPTQLVQIEEPRAQPVVDVVGVVGDVVGDGGDLRLQRRLPGGRRVGGPGHPRDDGMGIARRAVVLGEALQRLPGQIEAVMGEVAAFQLGDDAQRLHVVVEAAAPRHAGIERALARVAEGRMAEIVRERDGLRQILVQPQRAGDGARHLRDLERVREPGTEMVALMRDEDLRLVLEPAERGRVDDPVAVALVRRALVAPLRERPAERARGQRRPGRHGRLVQRRIEVDGVPPDGRDIRRRTVRRRPRPILFRHRASIPSTMRAGCSARPCRSSGRARSSVDRVPSSA